MFHRLRGCYGACNCIGSVVRLSLGCGPLSRADGIGISGSGWSVECGIVLPLATDNVVGENKPRRMCDWPGRRPRRQGRRRGTDEEVGRVACGEVSVVCARRRLVVWREMGYLGGNINRVRGSKLYRYIPP